MAMEFSQLDTQKIEQFNTIVKGIVRVHEIYDELVRTEYRLEECADNGYGEEWSIAYDEQMKTAAKLRAAIRAHFKNLNLNRVRNKYNGRELTGRDFYYDWIYAFNDSVYEYATFNQPSYDYKRILKDISVMTSYNISLPF